MNQVWLSFADTSAFTPNRQQAIIHTVGRGWKIVFRFLTEVIAASYQYRVSALKKIW